MSVVAITQSRNGVAHVEEVDWRNVRPEDVETSEECAEAMRRIDEIIGGIETQLRDSYADFIETGDRGDLTWRTAAKHALKRFKIARQAFQDRKGALSRAQRQAADAARNNSWPQRFVDAAREVLDPNTFEKIKEKAGLL